MNTSGIKQFIIGFSILGALTIGASQTQAIVVTSGSPGFPAPLNNTSPFGASEEWDRVQMQGNPDVISHGTNVYLGNGWVLTANHTGGKNKFNFGGSSYNIIPTSGTRLTNPDDGSLTDLYMYQVDIPDGDPLASMPNVTIASSVSVTDPGLMIGTGVTQVSLTSDTSYLGNDGFTTQPLDGDPIVREKKWANNSVAGKYTFDPGTSHPLDGAAGLNIHALLLLEFDMTTPGSGAATGGDSGSAFFKQVSPTEFELAGIAHFITNAVDNSTDPPGVQPPNTRVDGNLSVYSDLSFYKTQIEAILATTVPEPTTALLLTLGTPLLMARNKKRS
ncbi:PEP-CTERM sorting domain-containing protein [Poriferisphaera sp. WC338]|uniref:PEP-CTERM sorting domain-containing protein n=1 Tax=Poriferisphaera sp. WC338 TaxID=3425129 RepID=UPI003D817479